MPRRLPGVSTRPYAGGDLPAVALHCFCGSAPNSQLNPMGTVLFDLDGTLTDPKLGITRCIAYALRSLGEPVPSERDLIAWIGPPIQGSFQEYLGGADTKRAELAVKKFRERFTETGIFENSVYDGIPAALSQIKGSGARLILATSKPQPFAERIKDHFDLSRYFYAQFGSRFDGTLSNKAELIAHILKSESIDPNGATMVCD